MRGRPGLVAAQHQLFTRLECNAHLTHERKPVAIQVAVAPAIATVASLIPAIAEHHRQVVFSLSELTGDVKRLVLQPLIVGVAVGCEMFVANLVAIEFQVVKSQSTDINSGIQR